MINPINLSAAFIYLQRYTTLLAQLLLKSDLNLAAAEVLIKSSLFAPSVHCSYYAMFQLLKHKLVKKLCIDYLSLENDANDSGSGTHVYTINKLIEIFKNIDPTEARNLKNQIYDLKTLRLESDYFNLQIDSIKGSNALRTSNDIIRTIKKNL